MGTSMDSFRPEFDFRDGELLVTIPSKCMKIRGWPNPCALEKTARGGWQDFRPAFRLVKPIAGSDLTAAADQAAPPADGAPHPGGTQEAQWKKAQAFACFRNTMPPEVACALEPFESHQWNLLELISLERATLDLVHSNRVLAYMLANIDEFGKPIARTPAYHARKHVTLKQKEILDWLGFPPSDSMVRVVRKIIPEAISPHDARLLRLALRDEPAIQKMLAHLRVINAGVLALVTNLKLLSAVSPKLLAEVAGIEQERLYANAADLLVDAMYMHFMLGRRESITPFTSGLAIREFHDALEVEYLRAEAEKRRQRRRPKKAAAAEKTAPQPPLPGTEDIIPLTTKEQLRQEGKEQNNCVGGYYRRVRIGSTAVYKVLRPERATLAIVRGRDGFWHRSELKVASNRPVHWQTQIFIDRWLALFSLSV
jgi:hypothetical protein